MKLKKEKAFTVLELLIVIGILGILIGVSAGIYFSIQQNSSLDLEAQKISSALRLQQSKTLAAQSFDSHGVHFDTSANTYTLFSGSSYNAADPNNQVESLGDRALLNNVQFTGAGSDVVFDRLSGYTSNSGYIEVVNRADALEKRFICIELSGGVRALSISEDVSDCNPAEVEFTDGAADTDLASFPSGSAWGDPAQSFTTGAEALSVSRADLYLRYNDDDLGGDFSDLFLEIRESSTTGNVIGKSIIVDGDFVSPTLSWHQFIFPAPIQLNAGTQYFMRLRSLPSSSITTPGAEGTIIWGYLQSLSSPPGYAGGNAWRYVGANDNPADTGQQLIDYDFSFRLFSEDTALNTDARHLELNMGSDIRTYTNITLNFDLGAHIETITIADHTTGTNFTWEEDVNVGGNIEHIKIHSLYMDSNSTILSVHRGEEINDLSLDVDIDSVDLVDYTAAGLPTKGTTIESMVYR